VLYNNDMFCFIDGSKAEPPKKVHDVVGSSDQFDNPEYSTWFKQDQHVLSGRFTYLTLFALGHVQLLKMAAQVWQALDKTLACPSPRCGSCSFAPRW
jgi:regulatory protein YycI of two-component signal transduction system YycFG